MQWSSCLPGRLLGPLRRWSGAEPAPVCALRSVAARFNINVGDLLGLNPALTTTSYQLAAGQQLAVLSCPPKAIVSYVMPGTSEALAHTVPLPLPLPPAAPALAARRPAQPPPRCTPPRAACGTLYQLQLGDTTASVAKAAGSSPAAVPLANPWISYTSADTGAVLGTAGNAGRSVCIPPAQPAYTPAPGPAPAASSGAGRRPGGRAAAALLGALGALALAL
jgi:hypothetical protein